MSTGESLGLRNKPGFQCLEATAPYRNDISGTSICFELIIRNVTGDDKSQVFVLPAELTFSVTTQLATYLVEVFDGGILQVTFNIKETWLPVVKLALTKGVGECVFEQTCKIGIL